MDRTGLVEDAFLYIHSRLVVTDTMTAVTIHYTNYEDKFNNLVNVLHRIKHTLITAVYHPPDSPASRFKDLISAMQQKIDKQPQHLGTRCMFMYITSYTF